MQFKKELIRDYVSYHYGREMLVAGYTDFDDVIMINLVNNKYGNITIETVKIKDIIKYDEVKKRKQKIKRILDNE